MNKHNASFFNVKIINNFDATHIFEVNCSTTDLA